jgi:sensor c-di-GMP phosphodiesterase-like protein
MHKAVAFILTILVAVVAVLVPILLAIHFSRNEALEQEQARVLSYASDLLLRAETTSDELSAGIKVLVQSGAPACSPRSLALMREIDLASPDIQAVGAVSGTRLVCSSLGDGLAQVDLGPVDVLHRDGVRIRNSVVMPFAPNERFLVVEYKGYAAVIHKDVMFRETAGIAPAALALVALPQRVVLAARGNIDLGRIGPVAPGMRWAGHDGAFVTGAVASRRYRLMGVASVPVALVDARAEAVARKMIPVALGAGMLLALLVFAVANRQAGLPAILRGALRRDEFYLAYFPVVELETGQVVGAETLIRWRQRSGKVIMPDEFIPSAESHGLIMRITERVVELVGRDAGMLFERFPGFHVGINLAPEDLHDNVTVGRLQRLAELTQARSGDLVVEATERGFTDPALAAKVIDKLRMNGIAVAIDDFGTGYSSLSFLESFNLDYLKIDQAFVRTLGTDAATGTVVLHIIEMAKALNLEMIAEGVCTEEQAARLRERGVRYAQGWLFGKPMPLDDLVALLERQAAAQAGARG